MYHLGEGTRPCPFPVTRSGHERDTEPQGDHFRVRNLGMIPYPAQEGSADIEICSTLFGGGLLTCLDGYEIIQTCNGGYDTSKTV